MGIMDTLFGSKQSSQVTGPSVGGLTSMFNQLGPAATEQLLNIIQGGQTDVSKDPQLQALLQSIREQATQGFQEGVVPQISAAAQQGGNFFSTARQNQLQRAGQGFTQSLGQALAAPAFGAMENARARQLQALGMPAQVGQSLLSNQTKSSGSLFDNIGKMVGAGAGLVGGLRLSSRRFKRNIRTHGRLGPVRLVSWQWRQDGTPGLGVIAEELAQARPDLVAYDAAGAPLGVYYGRLFAEYL